MQIDRTDQSWRESAGQLAYCNYHPINQPPCGNEPAWRAILMISDPIQARRQPFGICAEHEWRYRANGGFDIEPLTTSAQAAL